MNKKREQEIINLANEARSKVGNIFSLDPIKIAKAYGLSVFTANFPREISGQIYYEKKEIIVESTDYITRQCFSIAHELGHYLLHKENLECKREALTYQSTNEKECEANYFAAELLMPRDEILFLIGNNYNLDSMAAYFGVSSVALLNRLNEFQIKVYV